MNENVSFDFPHSKKIMLIPNKVRKPKNKKQMFKEYLFYFWRKLIK